MSRTTLSWRAHARNPFLWVGLLCLCLALLFLPIGGLHLRDAQRLASDGIDTTATVVDHATHTSRTNNGNRRTSYSVTLRYADQRGGQHTTRLSVSSETYQRLGIGRRTPVRYVASDPTIAEVEPGANRRSGMIMAGVGAASALGALVLLVLFLRSSAAQRRAMERGERRLARIVAHHRVGKAMARVRKVNAEWTDDHISGRTRTMKEGEAPTIGTRITICVDPVSGKGWWVDDL